MTEITHALNVFSDGLVVETEANLLYSLPDYPSRNNPATRKCQTDQMFTASSKLERYIRAIDQLMNPGMASANFLKYWKSFYNGKRCFDNGNAWDSGHWKLENLFCAGATLRPVDRNIVKGWIQVYAIDPTNPPPAPKSLAEINMTLNFFPTIASNGGNQAFPQFGGRCLQPFLGENGRNWVRMSSDSEGRGALTWASKIGNPFIPARPDLLVGLNFG